jgi:hypothetical protein
MERTLNESLTGYTAQLAGLDFHPLGFAITLEGLTIRQDAHPEPPVLEIPRFDATVQWRALLHLELVADMVMEQPKLYVDGRQFQSENEDSKPVTDKGWQDAVESIYPLEINEFRVEGGDVTYVDSDNEDPVRLHDLDIIARNIRNVREENETYPSPIWARTQVFGNGSLEIDGAADFLQEPFPGVRARIDLRDIALARIKPIANNVNVWITDGVLAAEGELEYAPDKQVIDLKNVAVTRVNLDYVHSPATQAAEARRAEAVKETAAELATEQQTLLRLERLRIDDSRVAFINQTTEPSYSLVLTDTNVSLQDFSNQPDAGPATLSVNAAFMGSGPTTLDATFRPMAKTADLDIDLAVRPTDLTTLNDFLEAYGNFDVVDGTFALYTEVGIHDGQIDGYVKPLFEDMNVYASGQDAEKGLLRKAYEVTLEGVKLIFENPRDTVATETPISGTVDNPETSTWRIVINLARNAFLEAIVPGFERSLNGSKE